MAGSYSHINKNGEFTMDYIDNMGDAAEALEDCFVIIDAISAEARAYMPQDLYPWGLPKRMADLLRVPVWVEEEKE